MWWQFCWQIKIYDKLVLFSRFHQIIFERSIDFSKVRAARCSDLIFLLSVILVAALRQGLFDFPRTAPATNYWINDFSARARLWPWTQPFSSPYFSCSTGSPLLTIDQLISCPFTPCHHSCQLYCLFCLPSCISRKSDSLKMHLF